MTLGERITAVIVLAFPAVVILFDLVMWAVWGEAATITFIMRRFTSHWKEIPWVFAALEVWLWLHFFAEVVIDRITRAQK